jgi:hypothetical protein
VKLAALVSQIEGVCTLQIRILPCVVTGFVTFQGWFPSLAVLLEIFAQLAPPLREI